MEDFNEIIAKIRKGAIIFLFVMTAIGGLIFGYIISEVRNFSGIDNLKQFQPSIPTKIYDINEEIITELFHEKRDLVYYETLPRNLINAFLASEDREFYSHIGINPMAIIRAMLKNLTAGKITQGGSTITQQLAKRLFTSGERTFGRKAMEAILALQIEKLFTKEDILEMYFNQIYLGHGCYGVSSASKLFFNKEVKYLNVAESVILSTLPAAPGRYSPLYNTKNSYERSWEIFMRMVDAGFLTRENAKKKYDEFWPKFVDSIKMESPSKTVYSINVDKAPYFTDYIRQILLARFGDDVVYNEGLQVYTTLNLKRQEIGQEVIQDGLAAQNRLSGRIYGNVKTYGDTAVGSGFYSSMQDEYNMLRTVFNLPNIEVKNNLDDTFKEYMIDNYRDDNDILTLLTEGARWKKAFDAFRATGYDKPSSTVQVEGALIAIEPSSGYITTMVGGSSFNVGNQYNRSVQALRQPGSAFKSFVYGAGLEAKIISPMTSFPDAPILNIDSLGRTWSPANYEQTFYGMIPVRRGLSASINIVSIRIYDLLGDEIITNFASRMLKADPVRFNPNPTLALGTTDVSPFEMANGFAIYANRGRDVIPFGIRYVMDRDGNELLNIEEEVGDIIAAKEMNGTIQVTTEEVAYVMTSMLQSVVDGGTATEGIKYQAGFNKRCGGKTGTTQDFTDAWFCGFTPDIAAVVWIGYDQPYMTLGDGQGGAVAAAPLWGRYMKEIYKDMKDPVYPPEPEGIYHIGGEILIKGSTPGPVYAGEEYQMKTVMERYMEKEGLVDPEDMPENKDKTGKTDKSDKTGKTESKDEPKPKD